MVLLEVILGIQGLVELEATVLERLFSAFVFIRGRKLITSWKVWLAFFPLKEHVLLVGIGLLVNMILKF